MDCPAVREVANYSGAPLVSVKPVHDMAEPGSLLYAKLSEKDGEEIDGNEKEKLVNLEFGYT